MMAKTTRTRAPTDPSKVCKLRLTIYEDLDADMFCIKGGLGTCYHQHHEPRNVGKHRVRSTNLSPEIQKMVCDLKEPNCSSTQVQQCVKSQTGLTLPNHQTICLQNKLRGRCTGPAKTAAERLIKTLTQQDGVDFVLLFHKSSSANSTASQQDKHLSNPRGRPKKQTPSSNNQMKSKANPKQNKNGKSQSPKKPKPKSNSTQTKKKNSQINKKGKASTSQAKHSANLIKKKPNSKTTQSKKRGRIQCELHHHDRSDHTTCTQPSLQTVSTKTSISQV